MIKLLPNTEVAGMWQKAAAHQFEALPLYFPAVQ
jgi:hypothetical protein